MATICEACNNRQWILACNDTHGVRIERCDSCAVHISDDEAGEMALPLLTECLMRFDEGTDWEKVDKALESI